MAAQQWSDLSKRIHRSITTTGVAEISVLGVAELGFLVAALIDLQRRPASQIRGSKHMWRVALAFPNLLIPISYFVFGRRRRQRPDVGQVS